MVSQVLSKRIHDTIGLIMGILQIALLSLNTFLAWYMWRCAMVAFEDGKDAVGWIDIFFSAFNAAVVANALL